MKLEIKPLRQDWRHLKYNLQNRAFVFKDI
jgi:hypothetical protein